VALLRQGPGYITPDDVRGLIAFPSYHGVLALVVTFYAWPVRWLRWPVLLTNAVVLICTPIQGGHHLVDVLAAFPVAALSIFIASLGEKAQSAAVLSAVVNKKPKLSIGPVPQGLFRIDAEQESVQEPAAIKPKLSGAS
jgi:hypothetical protein